MAVQPIYEKLKNDYVRKMTGGQVVVEARLRTPESSKIAKVLSITADSKITGHEMLEREAKINGKVNFKVLYTDDAGENHCLNYTADFAEKLTNDKIEPTMKADVMSSILDVDTVSVSANEIKIATVVEISLNAMTEDEMNYLVSGGDELYIQSEVIKFQTLSGIVKGEFTLLEEIGCDKNVSRILLAEADAIVLNTSCVLDAVTVAGKAVVNITVEKEGGTVDIITKVISFEQEIGSSGVVSTDSARINIEVTKCEITLSTDDDSAAIKAEIYLEARGNAFREGECEVVTDAFSITHETKATTESVEVTKTQFSRAFEEKIEGTASLETEMPAVDKIMTTTASRINIANAYADKDKIVIEGVLNTSVIYYNTELNNLNSVQVELPYSITMNAPGVKEGHTLIAKGMVMDVSSKVRKISEVEVVASVAFMVHVDSSVIGYAITNIECGAERAPSNTAIAIYVTKKGESLWDVAKGLTTTPELILAQNPGLKLPLEGGERILVYHRLKAKF